MKFSKLKLAGHDRRQPDRPGALENSRCNAAIMERIVPYKYDEPRLQESVNQGLETKKSRNEEA